MSAVAPGAGRRCLWLAAELPSRLDTGLKVYSHGLAGSLAAAGVAVTMVGLGAAGPAAPGLVYESVDDELRGGWRSLFTRLPNLSHAASGPQLRQRILSLLAGSWDLVVVDHLQMAWTLDDVEMVRAIEANGAPVVFVAHNHEASVRRAVAAAERWWQPRRFLLGLDAAKAARLERRAVVRASLLTAITDHDRARFQAQQSSTPVLVVPPGYHDPGVDPPPMAQRPRRVVVLGSFDWHVKATNLRMMAEAMAGPLAGAGIELVIGGSMAPDLADDLAARGVRCVGFVDDVAEFLASGRIGLIVEPLGGGFKLKSLDYVFHRLAVAALEGSAAGLPADVERWLITEPQPSLLATRIVTLIDQAEELEQRVEGAVDAAGTAFRWDDRAAVILDALGLLTHPSTKRNG